MKKTILFIVGLMLSIAAPAQTARQILDKAAATVSSKGGATADFTMTGKYGNASGTITIKGDKFVANTPQAKMWFDGRTQWTYMVNTQEVNVSTPTQARQQTMNPYRFINLYKMGYAMTRKTVTGGYEVHLKATNKQRTITEMYVTVDKSYVPVNVKMKTDKGWTSIAIRNFKKVDVDDSRFRFNAKEYPEAEVIDLR